MIFLCMTMTGRISSLSACHSLMQLESYFVTSSHSPVNPDQSSMLSDSSRNSLPSPLFFSSLPSEGRCSLLPPRLTPTWTKLSPRPFSHGDQEMLTLARTVCVQTAHTHALQDLGVPAGRRSPCWGNTQSLFPTVAQYLSVLW